MPAGSGYFEGPGLCLGDFDALAVYDVFHPAGQQQVQLDVVMRVGRGDAGAIVAD